VCSEIKPSFTAQGGVGGVPDGWFGFILRQIQTSKLNVLCYILIHVNAYLLAILKYYTLDTTQIL